MVNELLMKNRHIIDKAKCPLKAALCALLVFYSGCSQSNVANKLNLEFKPEPGKLFTMRISIEDTVTEGPQGQQAKTNHIKTTDLGFYVNGVDDKGITSMKATFRAMREKTKSPMGSIDYDYANPLIRKEGPVAKIYNAMIGEGLLIKVTPAGEIAEIDAEDMFGIAAEKIVRTQKSTSDANQDARNARIEEIKQSIKSYPLTSTEYLKELIGFMIPSYPGQAIKVGDSWTSKVDTSKWTSYIPQTDGTYTLKEHRQGLALVEVNAERMIADKSIPESGGRATYTGTVKVEGNLEINEATGMLIHKQIKTRLAGDVNDQGKTWPIQVESTVTVE
ncbi:MAG: DUF6263 family protein [Planctomycetota bacterium]